MSLLAKGLVALLVASVHLVATIAALSRTSYPNPPSDTWGALLSILTFPLLSLGKTRLFGADILDWLVVANSVLWGIAIASAVAYLKRKRAARAV